MMTAARMADAGQATASEVVASLKADINAHVATPLAHALRLAGGCFNEISTHRHRRLVKGVRNQQLAKWLESSPESNTHLFAQDLAPAMEAARARRMDSLLAMAS